MTQSRYVPNRGRRKYAYSPLKHSCHRVLVFERFIEFLDQVPSGGTVLDYGSGDRPFESLLLEKFDRYIAGDHPQANASHVRRADVDIVHEMINLETASVDCVVLTEVMEHIPRPDVALAEINRVLKPGGYLVGTVPFAIGEHEAPYDFHRYTSFCLIRYFENAGFQIDQLVYVGDLIGVVVRTFSLVLQLIPKAIGKLRLAYLASAVSVLARIPEATYCIMKWYIFDPQKVKHFRSFPLGFAFLLHKQTATSPIDLAEKNLALVLQQSHKGAG